MDELKKKTQELFKLRYIVLKNLYSITMRSKLIFAGLLFLLLFSQTMGPKALDVNQEKPKFILRTQTVTSKGEIIKGVTPDADNSSGFELIVSRIKNTRDVIRVFGSPTVDINATHVAVNGSMQGKQVSAFRAVGTFMQKDEYIQDVPVNKRIKRDNADRKVKDLAFDVDRTFVIPKTYAELDGNENFTKVEKTDKNIVAFVNRYFVARVVSINDSDGSELGKVYGFRLFIAIIVFDSSDQSFLGLHVVTDFGYGNMLPDFVFNYLKNLPERRDLTPSDERLNNTRSGPLTKVDWMDMGYNETYNLDMLRGFYSFKRSVLTFVLPRAIDSVSSLGLSATDSIGTSSLETIIDDIADNFELDGFDDGQLGAVDDKLIGDTLQEEGKDLTNAFDSETNTSDNSQTPVNVYFLVIALISLPILKKKIVTK